MNKGSQAANQRFFAFPKIRLIYGFRTYFSLIIFYAKKILSRGEAVFPRYPDIFRNRVPADDQGIDFFQVRPA
jgi:hypothetical protein